MNDGKKDLLNEIQATEVLSKHIGGYHKCYLGTPPRLDFASEHLLEMVGYTRNELRTMFDDKYIRMIYPDDLERYVNFIAELSNTEQTQSIQYRIVKKDGDMLCVVETMTSQKDSEGIMWGYSTVSDITDFVNESGNVSSKEIVPCGVIHFICGEIPYVTYMNDHMRTILRADYNQSHVDDIKNNLMFLFPMSERKSLKSFIKRELKDDNSIRVVGSIMRSDGVTVKASLTFNRIKTEGKKECQVIITELDKNDSLRGTVNRNAIIEVVDHLFDEVILIDSIHDTVDVLKTTYYARHLDKSHFDVNEIIHKLIKDIIAEKDLNKIKDVLRFASDMNNNPRSVMDEIYFGLYNKDKELLDYSGRLIKLDDYHFLFGCKRENSRHENPAKRVYLRTFGHFDVLVDNVPILFHSSKAKELLALMVDRRGGYISAREVTESLWENEDYGPKLLARCRKTASRLKEELEENGISEIIEYKNGQRRVDIDKINCDLYDYLNGSLEVSDTLIRTYMMDYSWAEYSMGSILRED